MKKRQKHSPSINASQTFIIQRSPKEMHRNVADTHMLQEITIKAWVLSQKGLKPEEKMNSLE